MSPTEATLEGMGAKVNEAREHADGGRDRQCWAAMTDAAKMTWDLDKSARTEFLHAHDQIAHQLRGSGPCR